MRIAFAVVRILIGAAILAAVFCQLAVSVAFWQATGIQNLAITTGNYFSFFTIQSNLGAAVVLLIGAVVLLKEKGTDPLWYAVLRGVLVTYMATTGIVYNLLLRGIELPQGSTLEWSNEILHVVGPLYLILDWIFAPGRRVLSYRFIRVVVVFPILWVIYTLIRAPLTPDQATGKPYWYPYPFLDPHLSVNGYLSVIFYILLIAAVISLVGAGVVWLSNRLRPTTTPAERAPA